MKMNKLLNTILLSMLCTLALAGCSKEPKTNPTEPVNMAGALFILEEAELPVDEAYAQKVTNIFVPEAVEAIVHDRLAESNYLSGSQDFTGTHSYKLLVGEHFLSEEVMPDYVYLWIQDLNVLKKIYLIQGLLCDFNPKESMETECLDEAVGVLYEGSFHFAENAEFTYASKEDFSEQYQAFERIMKEELPLLSSEAPAAITVYVMQGFAWELEAGSIQAYADIQYDNGSSNIFEIHLTYDENGQTHIESQQVGTDIEDFPGIQKQLLYRYSVF